MSLIRCAALLIAPALFAEPLSAQIIDVRIAGVVEFNQVTTGPLAQVPSGTSTEITFKLDAANFVDSPNFPTRGYPLVADSFAFDLGAGTALLQNPLPPGPPPFFTLRDNDPAVDGFFLATSTDFPIGVPLNLVGGFGNFKLNFSVTYDGATLPSLDILDATGLYDFTGLSVFGFAIEDGPFQPVGLIFEELEISVDPSSVCGFETYDVGVSPTNDLELMGIGMPSVGATVDVLVVNAPADGAFFSFSTAQASLPLFGGVLLVDPAGQFLFDAAPISGLGALLSVPVPANPTLAGFDAYVQAAAFDITKPEGIALSNGLKATLCP